MSNHDHKRTKEQMRLKDRSAAQNAKLTSQTLKDKAKYSRPTQGPAGSTAKKPPAKKSNSAAKKPPPKKKR